MTTHYHVLLLSLITSTAFAAAPALSQAPPLVVPAAKTTPIPADVAWHDVTKWGVEGRAWGDQMRKRYFDRLPAKADGKVTPTVWGLSRDSAGMAVRFKTDATDIYVRYKLSKTALGMPHMPATGASGIDLYARDEAGKWRWVNVTKPATPQITTAIASGLAPGEREYLAYLPLFNGVDALEFGAVAAAKFEEQAPRTAKPIVFYGTSITHGACASRPGMLHTAILGRRLDTPVVNLGFSGNGKMDAAVGELLGEVDAAVFVIDCCPNMGPDLITERCVPLIKQLRAARPSTPIILVEDRRMTNEWIRPTQKALHDGNHAALKKAYAELQAAGIAGLSYIEGDHLYGDDGEGATDASHASDLGFMRQADIFEPVLRAALGK